MGGRNCSNQSRILLSHFRAIEHYVITNIMAVSGKMLKFSSHASPRWVYALIILKIHYVFFLSFCWTFISITFSDDHLGLKLWFLSITPCRLTHIRTRLYLSVISFVRTIYGHLIHLQIDFKINFVFPDKKRNVWPHKLKLIFQAGCWKRKSRTYGAQAQHMYWIKIALPLWPNCH